MDRLNTRVVVLARDAAIHPNFRKGFWRKVGRSYDYYLVDKLTLESEAGTDLFYMWLNSVAV